MKKLIAMALTAALVVPAVPVYAAEETTEAVTEAATEVATEAATEAASEAETEAATEAASEAETEAATEAASEAATEAATEAASEAGTEAATEAAEGEATSSQVVEADVAKRSSEAAPDWQPYNDLIAEIKNTTDTVEREALMHEAEDMLMETGAIVPLYYYNDPYLMKEDMSGMYCNLFGFKFFEKSTSASGKTSLNINLASEPDRLDPALNTTVDGGCLAVNSFVGLYTYDENGDCVPALAENTEVSEDGMTYTFTMLDGLKWSDGSELTAKDFEYSWKRAAAPETAADYSYLFDIIAKTADGELDVTASEDGKTLTVNLVTPCQYFFDLCAFPAFMPVQQACVEASATEEDPGAWAQEAGFVSNGAYTLQEWNHNESMVYVKNPNYYKADEVTMEELHFMLSADDTAIYSAYQAGDLDFADTIPTDEIANLLETSSEMYVADNLGTYYINFNVNSSLFDGLTPEQASAMRRGLSLLIDRQYIVDSVAQTGQKLANTFVPEGMADGNGGVFRANDDAYTYPDEENVGYFDPEYSEDNVAEARALLEEAGFKFTEDGMLSEETPLSFTFLVNEGSGNEGVAEAIQQDMAMVGIDMQIETQEWQVFLNERKAGNYDVARNGWLADYNDPINFLEMWTTDSGNNDCQLGR